MDGGAQFATSGIGRSHAHRVVDRFAAAYSQKCDVPVSDTDLRVTMIDRRMCSNTGVTLVELLVATTLSLATMATVLSFQRAQFFALRDQMKQLQMQDATRAVVALFGREMRRGGRDPACTQILPPIVV